MSLVLYAIGDGRDAAIDGPGLDGRPLRRVEQRGLAAIVSEGGLAGVDARPQTLWRYEQIVERLMTAGTILPARFGSVLADENAVRQLLAERRRELGHALERVRGSVEFGIRGQWRARAAADLRSSAGQTSGTAYMLARLELDHRARRAASLMEPLRRLATHRRERVLPRPSVPLIAAYLVARSDADRFVELARQLEDRLEEVVLTCTGPWPPYSFSQGEAR